MAHVQQLMDMGFSEGDARRALQQVSDNVEQAIERLLSGAVGGEPEFPALANETPGFDRFSLSSNSQDIAAGPPAATDAFPSLGNFGGGIEAESLGGAQPILDARKDGLPTGLRNVGNTCYVNSLLQTLLHLGELRKRMLCYRSPSELEEVGRRPSVSSGAAAAGPGGGGSGGGGGGGASEPEAEHDGREESAEKRMRRTHGVYLATELRRLFAAGLFTHRSCIDPSQLLAQLVDRQGNKMAIGSQEDVGEFMLKLLEQLEEGLRSGDFIMDGAGGSSGSGAIGAEPSKAVPTAAAAAAEGEAGAGGADADAARPGAAATGDDATMGDGGEPPAAGGAAAHGAPAEAKAGGKAQEAADDRGGAPPAEGEEKKALSLLQSFFFGEQVQSFSYRAIQSALPSSCGSDAGGDVASQESSTKRSPGQVSLNLPNGCAPEASGDAATESEAAAGKEERPAVGPPAVSPPPPPTASGGDAGMSTPPGGEGTAAPQATVRPPDASPCASECGAGPEQAPATDAPHGGAFQAVPSERDRQPLPVPDANGMVRNEEHSDFLHIFLDVKHKSLYRAWMASQNTEVDYQTPFGFRTKASTSTWIKRLPKLLFFQLQRVMFDKETQDQVKLDDPFEFEKKIYVDRFLLPNRSQAQEAAAHVQHLQDERDKLVDGVSSLGHYYKGRPNLGVCDVLTWAAECLESNARAGEAAAWSPPDAELNREAQSAVALLKGLSEHHASKISGMRTDADRLGEEIDEAYSGLRNEAYELYAIWVHSGIAGSGHYWAFIRDWNHEDRWYRLDDARVTVVPWQEVREAAFGQEGSHTSAYVLVYVDASLAEQQRGDQAEVRRDTEMNCLAKLVEEIRHDNLLFKEEQKQAELRLAEQELRRDAEAIFQHYAGQIHQWEPQKRMHDLAGNAMDTNSRKTLHDAGLLSYDLFLYRISGEQDVWTALLTKSIEMQRALRKWKPEDEGRILFFLSGTLRSQQCYSSMLRDVGGLSNARCCELVPLEEDRPNQWAAAMLQAFIIDEAVTCLQNQKGLLVKTVSMLAFIWAHWRLDVEDRFRQNEVLLLMSTLIYNTVNVLERAKKAKGDISLFVQPAEYFMLLLHAVEWPRSWKQPLMQRLKDLFDGEELVPSAVRSGTDSTDVMRESVLNHQFTQEQAKGLGDFERRRPEPGDTFFARHKELYAWVMNGDEKIAQEYVLTIIPDMPGVRPTGHSVG